MPGNDSFLALVMRPNRLSPSAHRASGELFFIPFTYVDTGGLKKVLKIIK